MGCFCRCKQKRYNGVVAIYNNRKCKNSLEKIITKNKNETLKKKIMGKTMKQFGKVDVPQEAFIALAKNM